MRALLLALCLVTVALVAAPVTDARGPGGGCTVKEEYVAEAAITNDPATGLPTVQPGARGPIECYY